MNIKEIKKELRITDVTIARWFGYANVQSYRNSSGKPKIEAGLIQIYLTYVKPLITLIKFRKFTHMDSERMLSLIKQITVGEKIDKTGMSEEDRKIVDDLINEIKDIKARGLIVDIPSDWPDMG